MFEYGVISDPYFPIFSPNTEKYGPEITPYLDTFHAVSVYIFFISSERIGIFKSNFAALIQVSIETF